MSLLTSNADALLATVFGAILQELLHWYGLRTKLSQKRYQRILRSTGYWLVTLAVILLIPVAVLLWFADTLDALALRDFVLLGAAFPTLFKTIVARFSDPSDVKLGKSASDPDAVAFKFSDYLGGR